ncbi:hypothetical protein LRU_00106 [Ligilactobacillus ruminis SPM0211]|uniref:Uncharacterized protein n=1 Tax=Ligilactobacillus ruminis SPM0211 TaxID=1040964 RepID=F7QXF3_9LACO|nr:hypothetical protein LRU_00106 [Ligilactobacillus ruminis SPM0211]
MPPIWTASNFDPLSIVPFATDSSVEAVWVFSFRLSF